MDIFSIGSFRAHGYKVTKATILMLLLIDVAFPDKLVEFAQLKYLRFLPRKKYKQSNDITFDFPSHLSTFSPSVLLARVRPRWRQPLKYFTR